MGIWRTQTTPETNPIPIEAGEMVQQRNTIMVEVDHDMGKVAGDLALRYYLQPRAYYDGVWDYGPDVFSDDDTRSQYGFDNREQIDDLKKDLEFFLGFADLSYNDAFLRLGKQVFQWGEMSTVRILDACIPTDNQSLGVDLEERLVPLTLARGGYTFFDVGPASSMTIEGYYINGGIDDTYGEDIIDGSAVVPPTGRSSSPSSLETEEDFTDDDRYGIRLGAMFGDTQLYLAHYRKYSDSPSVQLIMPSGAMPYIQKSTETIDVFGGSFSRFFSSFDGVIRGEIGYFVDEPMTYGSDSSPAVNNGEVPHHDVLRWGVAVDKNWVLPALNPLREFVTTLELVGTSIQNYDSRLTYSWPDPETGEAIKVQRHNFKMVAVASTEYYDGKLNPRFSAIYDISTQTFMFLPAVILSNGGNLNFEIGYRYTASDTYEGLGFLKDNDELTLKLTYYF